MPYGISNNIAFINGQNGPYDNKIKDKNVRYGRNAVANYMEYLQGFQLPKDAKTLPDLAKLTHDSFEQRTSVEDLINQTESLLADLEAQSKKVPPLSFRLKYLPEDRVDAKNLNKPALLGAAFEDLGKRESVSVAELNQGFPEQLKQKCTMEAFDVNNDGQIDIAEDAAAILIKDMVDKIPTNEILETGKIQLQADKLDGIITKTGETNFWTFLSTKNTQNPKGLVDKIMVFFNKRKYINNKDLITQVYKEFQLAQARDDFFKNPNNSVQ